MPNFRRGRFPKKIDTVHWTYGSFTFLAQGAGTAAVNVLAAQHLPETLLRIRGEVVVGIDGLQAPPLMVGIGIGLIQVPEGTGSTVLWSPISDGDAPWIYVDYFAIGYEEMVADAVVVNELMGARRVIDSKAMRKIRNTEIQAVIENGTIQGAMAVNLVGNIRVLAGA